MNSIRLFIILAILQTSLLAQTNNDIIAKIGNISISKKEFLERYEFTPQVGREQKGTNENLKMEVLYTMIAEKLWAAQAEKTGMDTIAIIKNSIAEYEKIFVRDGLFNKEIKDKAKIDADLYLGEYLNSPSYVKITYISSDSEKRIKDIAALLNSGYSFDSLANDVNSKDSVSQTAQFEVGQLPEKTEKEMFNLAEGKTGPYCMLDSLWIVYEIEKRGPLYSTFITPSDENFLKLKKIALEKAINKYYWKFRADFFKGKKVDTDGKIFKALARNIFEIFKSKNDVVDTANNKIYLSYQEIQQLKKMLTPDTLKMNYVRFETDPVSTEEFLKYITLENFFATSRDLKNIVNSLNAKNKEFIERELLTREGYKQNLQNSTDVKYWLDVWKRYILSEAFQTTFNDSAKVNDEQIRDYYTRHYTKAAPVDEVNIIEILTDSLNVIEKVFDEIKNGADFKTLAAKYTKREWAKSKGGEFGYFSTSMYEDIGRIAGGLNVGQMYGPLKVPEGYSLFKVIDKRTRAVTEIKKFDEIKDELKKDISYNKLRNTMINYTARLASEYGLEINEDAVKNIEVTNLNVIVYRFLGFGGRLPAMPFVRPFTDWVEPWKNIKKQSL